MSTPAEETPISADELLGRLSSPAFRQVKSVPLFIAPHDLLERHAELDREYARAQAESISLDSAAPGIAAELVALEDELAQYEVTFKVAALPRKKWHDLLAAHPPTAAQKKAEGGRLDFNPETFPGAAIAACLVSPAMTREQVEVLENGDENGDGGLTDAQFNVLFNAVVLVNQSGLVAPNSLAAAAHRRLSAAS